MIWRFILLILENTMRAIQSVLGLRSPIDEEDVKKSA